MMPTLDKKRQGRTINEGSETPVASSAGLSVQKSGISHPEVLLMSKRLTTCRNRVQILADAGPMAAV
jgi:hypothetical protein